MFPLSTTKRKKVDWNMSHIINQVQHTQLIRYEHPKLALHYCLAAFHWGSWFEWQWLLYQSETWPTHVLVDSSARSYDKARSTIYAMMGPWRLCLCHVCALRATRYSECSPYWCAWSVLLPGSGITLPSTPLWVYLDTLHRLPVPSVYFVHQVSLRPLNPKAISLNAVV